jgi:hypothetical protein
MSQLHGRGSRRRATDSDALVALNAVGVGALDFGAPTGSTLTGVYQAWSVWMGGPLLQFDLPVRSRQQPRIGAPDPALTPNAGLAITEPCDQFGVIGALEHGWPPCRSRCTPPGRVALRADAGYFSGALAHAAYKAHISARSAPSGSPRRGGCWSASLRTTGTTRPAWTMRRSRSLSTVRTGGRRTRRFWFAGSC